MNTPALAIRKTYKLHIGGKFVRSESGRVLPAQRAGGQFLDNFSHASRKDLRDAVSAARAAQPGWEKATPYLRGQILYRAAEMLQQRAGELEAELARATSDVRAARREVTTAVDRLVHYAGWSDKYQSVFGSVNPVATPHFNFTTPEPTGVIALLAPDEPALAAPVALLAAAIVSGNTVVIVASDRLPLPLLTFAEVLATSDVPSGVVNVLAGRRAELAAHIASHMDINAVVDATGDAALGTILRTGSATNLKRCVTRTLPATAWFSAEAENPRWITDTVEFKTAWHPVGV